MQLPLHCNNIDKSNYDEIKSTFSINNFVTSFSFLDDAHSENNQSYLSNTTKYKFDENRSLSFSGRRNRELDMTEFYNLIYEWKNDCLVAGLEYKKDYYNDSDVKPNESLFITLTIVPFGKFNTTIDVSWYNAYKDRECVIKLDGNEYILWNDVEQTVSFQKNHRDFPLTINYSKHASPLERSIKQFMMFNNDAYIKQKELTIQILRILNNGSKI